MMRYNQTLKLLLLGFAFLGCQSGNEEKIVEQRPNIVFILADDLGWADLPCYGNPLNEAPNLDQLAREGMQFMNAYAASPVCSPTRASIQAGQYPARLGIDDFITGHWRPYEELQVPINRTQYLPEEVTTIGEAMQQAGYATGYFGKWHLGWEEKHLPGNQGYEDWRIHRRGVFYNLQSNNAIYPPDSNLTDDRRLSEVLTDYSIDFIERNQETPFFLMLAHYDVHVQLDADTALIEKYLAKENDSDYPGNAVYAGMIEHVDRSVGRIIQKLEELGLAAHTMVVFFSDNGGLVSRFDEIPLLANSKLPYYADTDLQYIASSNAPLRAEKGTLYEGGIRVPMIVKWPGHLEAGQQNHQLISSIDFYPTFLELAQMKTPPQQILDGESIIPKLQNLSQYSERAIFWHYPVYHHSRPASAMRQGDYKLISFFIDQHEEEIELYHLKSDIGETKESSVDHYQTIYQMTATLNHWKNSVNAATPVPNPDFDPEKRFEWGKHPSRQ